MWPLMPRGGKRKLGRHVFLKSPTLQCLLSQGNFPLKSAAMNQCMVPKSTPGLSEMLRQEKEITFIESSD